MAFDYLQLQLPVTDKTVKMFMSNTGVSIKFEVGSQFEKSR